jgi:hypothetical protein
VPLAAHELAGFRTHAAPLAAQLALIGNSNLALLQ